MTTGTVCPDPGALQMWIETVCERFPMVVGHRRVEMVLQVIEMIEGHQPHEPAAEHSSALQRRCSVRIVREVDCNHDHFVERVIVDRVSPRPRKKSTAPITAGARWIGSV
jgi:hypothetical protein